jgi:queuosine precursor transporter
MINQVEDRRKTRNKEKKFLLLAGIFIAALVISNAIASKITSIFGIAFSVSAFSYALTFPMTDVIGEVWGKRRAHHLVWTGFFASIIAVIFIWIAIVAPPASFWQNQEAYEKTLSVVGRIVFGSLIAYMVSQYYDVWSFHFCKKKTSGKYLWLRNNASTWSSQLIDSIIFISIAFYGILPTTALLSTMAGQYLVKITIAAIDTPVVYWLVSWVNRD